jgi:hypothetical protein
MVSPRCWSFHVALVALSILTVHLVPTENSILKKISKVREPRRANHSGFWSMIASLGEVSPSRALMIVPAFIVSTYIKENGSQATRRS